MNIIGRFFKALFNEFDIIIFTKSQLEKMRDDLVDQSEAARREVISHRNEIQNINSNQPNRFNKKEDPGIIEMPIKLSGKISLLNHLLRISTPVRRLGGGESTFFPE
ncbi:hypothetical protein C0584_05550 [Candidatus Parcubacteria bacterium]|mgnify:CR=1 FL=1|nr:MAG: hypothetical protein C0584_05550 [Candidatus Parcubacteria bacterium]